MSAATTSVSLLADSAGAVYPNGNAGFFGDLTGVALANPVVGIAATGFSSTQSGTKTNYAGGGSSTGIAIGGVIAHNLILYGAAFGTSTANPDKQFAGASTVGDLGNGLMYFAGRMLGLGGDPTMFTTADYGTKFIVVAGLLNVIAAVDAHNLRTGRKS